MRPSRLAFALLIGALPGLVAGQQAGRDTPPPSQASQPPQSSQPGTPQQPGTLQQPAGAEAPPRARIWQFSPRIGVREDYTDNVRQQADALAQSGWISTLSPGLSLDHEGPRLRVNADYSYEKTYHAGASDLDTSQNFLNATGTYQVYERNASIEGRASITQENRSAFAAPVVPGSSTANANRAETRVLGISPILRGQLGDVAIWRARYNETDLRTRGDFAFAATELRTSELLLGARSAAAAARIGWSAEASGLQSRADSTGTLEDKRIRGDLVFGVAPLLHLLLIEGYEKTDFTREGTASGSTPGGGIEWSPGPRTQLAAVAQRRFFGTGHLATFNHRTSRLAFRLASTKDATVLTNVIGGTAGTLQSLMENLLLSSIPDPLARSEAARNRLSQLGAAPTSVNTGFLTERPFVFDSQNAPLTFIGVRNTFVASYERRVQNALGNATGVVDSFAQSDEIRQRNYRVAWNYRLTPLTTASLAASSQKSNGVAPSSVSTREDLVTLFLSSQLGPRTTGLLGFRRIDFDSTQAPGYRENAIFVSLSFRL